jgi:hypothetical protein
VAAPEVVGRERPDERGPAPGKRRGGIPDIGDASCCDRWEASMLVIWLGALLVLGGILYMAAQPLWRARLSSRRDGAPGADATLEPRRPAAGFGLATNWPGFALIALGAILLLVGAAI